MFSEAEIFVEQNPRKFSAPQPEVDKQNFSEQMLNSAGSGFVQLSINILFKRAGNLHLRYHTLQLICLDNAVEDDFKRGISKWLKFLCARKHYCKIEKFISSFELICDRKECSVLPLLELMKRIVNLNEYLKQMSYRENIGVLEALIMKMF